MNRAFAQSVSLILYLVCFFMIIINMGKYSKRHGYFVLPLLYVVHGIIFYAVILLFSRDIITSWLTAWSSGLRLQGIISLGGLLYVLGDLLDTED
ncbi:MAG: hypothetical protein DRP52_01680 [Planctomycetota bacterium]|nr:MAG: hypothetical protein DRP52_01680 [Planctomycetota bacterium]